MYKPPWKTMVNLQCTRFKIAAVMGAIAKVPTPEPQSAMPVAKARHFSK